MTILNNSSSDELLDTYKTVREFLLDNRARMSFAPDPGVPFTDCLPPLEDIELLCAKCPGLAKAYDNFKLLYVIAAAEDKCSK